MRNFTITSNRNSDDKLRLEEYHFLTTSEKKRIGILPQDLKIETLHISWGSVSLFFKLIQIKTNSITGANTLPISIVLFGIIICMNESIAKIPYSLKNHWYIWPFSILRWHPEAGTHNTARERFPSTGIRLEILALFTSAAQVLTV